MPRTEPLPLIPCDAMTHRRLKMLAFDRGVRLHQLVASLLTPVVAAAYRDAFQAKDEQRAAADAACVAQADAELELVHARRLAEQTAAV